MKKRIAGNIMFALAILFAVAGIVLYWMNTHGGYYSDFTIQIVILAVLAIVVMAAIKVLSARIGEKKWIDLLYVLAAVLLAWTAVTFLGNRVESAAIILGSELEAGNALAKKFIFMAFASVGCFVLGMIFTGVAGFFEQSVQKPEV